MPVAVRGQCGEERWEAAPSRPPAGRPGRARGAVQVSLPLRSQRAGRGKGAVAPPGRDRAGGALAALSLGGAVPGAGRSSGPAGDGSEPGELPAPVRACGWIRAVPGSG